MSAMILGYYANFGNYCPFSCLNQPLAEEVLALLL